MKAKKKHRKSNKIITNLALICCIVVFLFSTWKLVGYLTEYKKGEQIYIKIAEHVTVPKLKKNKKGEKVMETPEINWDALEEMNGDIAAWIYIDGTSIQYPVTLGQNNEYYLTHTFDKKTNKCGSIFMDVGCQGDFSSDNTILYGHNMKTGKMFGSLKFYKDPDYRKDHPDIYLITRDHIRKYKIFAAYETVDTSDVYQLEFASPEDKKDYIEMCKKNSLYDTGVDTEKGEFVLTLSTCTSATEEGRFVVQGVLVSDKEIDNES